MSVVYMLRHEHAGIVTSHVFLDRPTDAQLAPLLEDLARRHPPGWITLHEAAIVGDGEIPFVPAPPGDETGDGSIGQFSITGAGEVANP